ncbi:MAG TPA: nicotinate-nucleotide adenylyltransferase [Deltaproteobacteria bacterium]|nr:nicotinate-nucleotide adenylyltransferase [Deltaproteobacteria bacterium]
MRLGIFGGTFNPIHVGHLRAAEEVREALGLDRVVFVPSAIPPHKELADGVDAGLRLAMVRGSIAGNDAFEVSSFEVDRPGPSYSVHTIEHYRGVTGSTPYFVLGQDAFNEIATWHMASRLFRLAHFAVMTRPGAPRHPLEKILPQGAPPFVERDARHVNEHGNEIVYVEVTRYEVSSSMIRSLVRGGKSIRYLVTDAVRDIINAERIYQ